MVSDGLTVAPANLGTGGEMVMTITGLSAGHHTLLTYHNAWDALAAGSLGPMDVFVNGVQAVDNLDFEVDMHNPGKFAALLRDDLTLYLSAPGAGSGGQAGGDPKPGGWNRFMVVTKE